ncbi:hypothetical protein BUPH_08550 (plasmid) [Paraburkholderia phenoliruptrix BR3459a]|uniref:Uncharacterized protein n=1 Tax=Paraburkholderia phenoliruptrix BR3459a TaxID=1229205 RepID=K0E0S4_9BURK|nr:hypothetical protein BUPH_08550 [Paraburkholderia phenoliruptrix BR3459a]
MHQDLGLVPSPSVAGNLALTCGFTLRGGTINRREAHRHALKLFDEQILTSFRARVAPNDLFRLRIRTRTA